MSGSAWLHNTCIYFNITRLNPVYWGFILFYQVRVARWHILKVRHTQKDPYPAAGGGAQSFVFFVAVVTQLCDIKQALRIYASINFGFNSWKRLLPLAREKINIIIFFVIAVFMKLWKVYICAAPFRKTYLPSEMETRDMFMADSHSSVPLRRDAHSLWKGFISALLLWLFTEKLDFLNIL